MKVKILKNVSGFYYNGVDYKPGQTVEIDGEQFSSYFMEELPVPIADPAKIEIVSNPPHFDFTAEPEPVETTPAKPKRKKRKKIEAVEEEPLEEETASEPIEPSESTSEE